MGFQHLHRFNALNRSKFFPVQSGEVTLSGTSQSATISPVTLSKSILFFSFTCTAVVDDPTETAVSGQITNSNTLTFKRNGAPTSTCTIYYYVIEARPSTLMTVQRGSIDSGSSKPQPVNQSISTVNLGYSFSMSTFRSDTGRLNSTDVPKNELTTTTNLQFAHSGVSAQAIDNEWQVIEMLDWPVQKINRSTGPTTLENFTITAIPLADCFMCFSVNNTAAFDSNRMFSIYQTSTTNLRAQSNNMAGTKNFTIYAVDTKGDLTKQETNPQTLASTILAQDTPITNVTPTNTFLQSGCCIWPWGQGDTSVDGDSNCIKYTLNNQNIRAERNSAPVGEVTSYMARAYTINGLI